MALLAPRDKNIDNKVSKQSGKKKVRCCWRYKSIWKIIWIKYDFQQFLYIENIEISKGISYSSSYPKTSMTFFEVRYCHWAKRLGRDKNWKQLVGFYVPGVKRFLTNCLTINLEDKCHT